MAENDYNFREREQAYMNGLGGQLGGIILAEVDASFQAKSRYIELMKTLFAMDNLDLKTKVSLIGQDPLALELSIPAALIPNNRVFDIKRSVIKTHMETSSHAEDNLSVAAEASASGSAKFSFGPFGGGSASFSAKSSVSNDRKRSSDYTSSMDVEIEMEQQEPSEMVAALCDSIKEFTQTANDCNIQIVKAQMNAQVAELDPQNLPAPSADEQQGE